MKKIHTKQNEIDYPNRLNREDKEWLFNKPFRNKNLNEPIRIFQDFSTILFLIHKHQPKAKKIVELGCGPGWLAFFLAKFNFKLVAYDISSEMIKIAERRAQNEKVKVNFKILDIEETSDPTEFSQNEVVIIYDTLHHCQSDEAVLGNAVKYLKNNGILILAEPNTIHQSSPCALGAVKKYGVRERGLKFSKLKNILKKNCLKKIWRYHASGKNALPYHEGFFDTIKMLIYPFWDRFFLGRKYRRIWIVAQK